MLISYRWSDTRNYYQSYFGVVPIGIKVKCSVRFCIQQRPDPYSVLADLYPDNYAQKSGNIVRGDFEKLTEPVLGNRRALRLVMQRCHFAVVLRLLGLQRVNRVYQGLTVHPGKHRAHGGVELLLDLGLPVKQGFHAHSRLFLNLPAFLTQYADKPVDILGVPEQILDSLGDHALKIVDLDRHIVAGLLSLLLRAGIVIIPTLRARHGH